MQQQNPELLACVIFWTGIESITASPPSASFSLPCLEILREKIYKTSI
jgi:hypothetical protein